MKNCVDNAPKNYNNCIYKKNISQHLDIEDYCLLNKKSISRIIMDEDCQKLQMGE